MTAYRPHRQSSSFIAHRLARWAIVGLVVGFSGVVGAARAENPPSAAAPSPPVRGIVAESALLRVVELVATPARTAGVLESIEVKEGDVVQQGALLAKVDDTDAKLLVVRAQVELQLSTHQAANDVAIRSAEKGVAYTGSEYRRLRSAYDGLPGSISRSELEKSRSAADQALFDLEQARHERKTASLTQGLKKAEQAIAQRSVEIHKIVAPLGGMVVEVLRRRGEWVEPGEDVLRIMRIDRMRAEGLVLASEIAGDLRGAPAVISVPVGAGKDITVTGRVVFVHPEINPVNGRVRVRAEFDNPGSRLMPGMRASMVIQPRDAKRVSSANRARP